jgi:hypothetical protein
MSCLSPGHITRISCYGTYYSIYTASTQEMLVLLVRRSTHLASMTYKSTRAVVPGRRSRVLDNPLLPLVSHHDIRPLISRGERLMRAPR